LYCSDICIEKIRYCLNYSINYYCLYSDVIYFYPSIPNSTIPILLAKHNSSNCYNFSFKLRDNFQLILLTLLVKMANFLFLTLLKETCIVVAFLEKTILFRNLFRATIISALINNTIASLLLISTRNIEGIRISSVSVSTCNLASLPPI